MGQARYTEADMRRLFRSAREAGWTHFDVSILPDGTIRAVASEVETKQEATPADLIQWKKPRKNG